MLASLFTFKGGVKPASHKDESTRTPIVVDIETNVGQRRSNYDDLTATAATTCDNIPRLEIMVTRA